MTSLAPFSALMLVLLNMFLFAILASVLWYIFIVSFYQLPSRGIRGIFLPWFHGVLVGIGALTITLSFLSRMPFNINFVQHFGWVWLRGTGWPMSLAVLTVIVISLLRPTAYSRLRIFSGCFSGVATIYLLWYALMLDPGFEVYRLFFMPIVWMAAIGITAFLVDWGLRIESWPRYPLLFAAVLMPSLLCFIPIIYTLGELLIAWTLAVILALLTPVLAFLDSRGKFN